MDGCSVVAVQDRDSELLAKLAMLCTDVGQLAALVLGDPQVVAWFASDWPTLRG